MGAYLHNDGSPNRRKARPMALANAPLIAALPAHDIERAKRWYEEKLGLTPAMEMGLAEMLQDWRQSVAAVPDTIRWDRQAHTGWMGG